MPLDGLRAWIGEVERKLGVRTRVFLVLAVIAIGGAGAAIYLAVDARNSSISEGDVQALQEKLEARIGEGGGSAAGTGAAQLETELSALQAQVEQLSGENGKSGQGGSNTGGSSNGGGSGSESSSTDGGSSEGTSSGATGGDANHSRLEELLERAKKQSEQDESEQSEQDESEQGH
jgi:hypothetical protein